VSKYRIVYNGSTYAVDKQLANGEWERQWFYLKDRGFVGGPGEYLTLEGARNAIDEFPRDWIVIEEIST
jgi:hypothetical protein